MIFLMKNVLKFDISYLHKQINKDIYLYDKKSRMLLYSTV